MLLPHAITSPCFPNITPYCYPTLLLIIGHEHYTSSCSDPEALLRVPQSLKFCVSALAASDINSAPSLFLPLGLRPVFMLCPSQLIMLICCYISDSVLVLALYHTLLLLCL